MSNPSEYAKRAGSEEYSIVSMSLPAEVVCRVIEWSRDLVESASLRLERIPSPCGGWDLWIIGHQAFHSVTFYTIYCRGIVMAVTRALKERESLER